MIPRVKICGVTRRSDAELAVKLGADALGFNFYEKSPRCVSAEQARAIIERLPRRVMAVGVFVNARPAEVLRIAKKANLQMVHSTARNRRKRFVNWRAGIR